MMEKENSGQLPEIYSVNQHVPLEQLSLQLKLNDTPTAELSAVDWQDRETVIDELATFFPFPRYFTREWEAVKEAVAEQVEKGKLVLVRGLTPAALPHLGLLVDYAAAALSRRQGGEEGRIVWVLEGLPDVIAVRGQDRDYPVTKLTVTEHIVDDGGLYKLQVSGKRNHTYSVNVALKVLARRPWTTLIELSGLGNGTRLSSPSPPPKSFFNALWVWEFVLLPPHAAIPAIVSIAEILKRYKVTTVERIETSLVELTDEGRKTQKAKMVVLLRKISSSPIIPDDDSEQTI